MKNTPSFDRSPIESTRSNINTEYWNTVLELYDNREDAKVLPALMNYINPELKDKYGNEDGTIWEIPHGSIVINVEQTDSEITIKAPFLDISGSAKIPLMRQVASLNFHPLKLTNIVLDDDELQFICKVPLELNEPYKLYDIFREICINADRYDDEFITKFKAKWIQEPRVEHYSTSELDTYWRVIQKYVSEAKESIQYLESKRIHGYVYDVLLSTFMKIDYYIAPQGYVRSEFEKQIADIDGRDPFNDRIHRAKEFLNKLSTYEKEAFLSDIYKADVFIPYKHKSNIENVRKSFERSYDTATDEMNKQSHMGAYFTMYCKFLALFYDNNVEDYLAGLIIKTLDDSADTPWVEGAGILMDTFSTIMDESKYSAYLQSLSE